MVFVLKLIAVTSAIVCLSLYLLGCAHYEGGGYYNSGKPRGLSCVKRDARGNEVWGPCSNVR